MSFYTVQNPQKIVVWENRKISTNFVLRHSYNLVLLQITLIKTSTVSFKPPITFWQWPQRATGKQWRRDLWKRSQSKYARLKRLKTEKLTNARSQQTSHLQNWKSNRNFGAFCGSESNRTYDRENYEQLMQWETWGGFTDSGDLVLIFFFYFKSF